MKLIRLSLLAMFALAFSVSAQAQVFTFDINFTNNQSVNNTLTGTLTVASGKVTQLVLNPFTYHGNNGNNVALPTLTWTQNTVGTDEGTFATGNNSAGVSGSTLALNVTGTSIPVNGASISFTFDTNSSGITDFSGGYPYGTQFFTSTPSSDFTLQATPEPSTWALILAGMSALVFVSRRKINA